MLFQRKPLSRRHVDRAAILVPIYVHVVARVSEAVVANGRHVAHRTDVANSSEYDRLILKVGSMHFVTTSDKTRLYVKDWGTGRPVILIHGWPLSADSWDDQAMAIADAGYRAIAYDRRGFGRSSQPWNGYDYDTLADDLSAVIEQTHAQDATLVGFSMGGGEVARYMSRHERKKVVQAGLISSILPYRLKTQDNPAGTEQADLDLTAQSLMYDRPAFLTGFFKNFFGVSERSLAVSPEMLQ